MQDLGELEYLLQDHFLSIKQVEWILILPIDLLQCKWVVLIQELVVLILLAAVLIQEHPAAERGERH